MKNVEVGIDWSKQFVDLCATFSGETLIEERIAVNAVGFNRLAKLMSSLKEKYGTIKVAIEDKQHIVAGFLMRQGYEVYAINPLALKRFKETFSFAGRKDDRFDAYCLALFLCQNNARLQPINKPGFECEELARHLAIVEQVAQERKRSINRLRDLLERYFPAFSAFYSKLSESSLELLRTVRTPEELRKLTLEQFLEKTNKIKYLHKKRTLRFFETMKQEMLPEDVPLANVHASHADFLIDQVLLFIRQEKKLRAEITRIYKAHPMYEIFASIPGCGNRIGPMLLAEMGDNLDKFISFRNFQSYAGTSPITMQSGKRRPAVTMRRACRKSLRHVLYLLAFCSTNYEPWTREYYDAARGRGMTHSRAVRSLSNKWAKIVFSMWKNGERYDREKFMEKRAA